MDYWYRMDVLIRERSSRKAVAAAAGIGVSTIATAILRRTYFRADINHLVAEHLGVTDEYLITGRDPRGYGVPPRMKGLCADLMILPNDELAGIAAMVHVLAERYRKKMPIEGAG